MRIVLFYGVAWCIAMSFIVIGPIVYLIQFFHAYIIMLRTWPTLTLFTKISFSIGIGALSDRLNLIIIMIL